MLLHIALVSITKEVTLANLAPVSAAIQKQVSRDFGPMWNVEATVDAFDKLEDVPIGYWHVLLQDELPTGAARRIAPSMSKERASWLNTGTGLPARSVAMAFLSPASRLGEHQETALHDL
jgi:hypothetical protein